jgi:hypothetical protein
MLTRRTTRGRHLGGRSNEQLPRLAGRYVRRRDGGAVVGHWRVAAGAPTLKIVVPYPPASGPDILSRLMAEQIGRMSGPTVVVENRPGGGTLIGTEAVQRAAPDGTTVLLVANSFVVNPALKKLGYDPVTSSSRCATSPPRRCC